MDQDIEDLVKSCRGCDLAAKPPPINVYFGQKLMCHGPEYT